MQTISEIFARDQYLRAKDAVLFKQVRIGVDEFNLPDGGK